VYESKMMAGIMTLLDAGRWPAGTTLVAVLGWPGSRSARRRADGSKHQKLAPIG
jgi:hypothetical protein